MSKCIATGLALAILLSVSSCGVSNKLYNWQNYEHTSYAYSKKHSPEAEAKLMETYKKLMETQNVGRKVVPPGMCAEYGYMLIKQGKNAEGIALLEKEISLYPESEKFIGRIIKQFKK